MKTNKLFERLLRIQSVSHHEEEMISFLMSYLLAPDNLPPDTTVDMTPNGNIFVTVGYAPHYPLLVAHTDTVHSIIVPDTVVSEDKGKRITTETLPYVVKRYRNKNQQLCYTSPTGVGGDDKCGIWILLQIYKHHDQYPPFKLFFPVGEEAGMTGTTAALSANAEWFSDVAYMIEPDRRGSGDVICDNGDTLADELAEYVTPLFADHGYKIVSGSITDIFKISPVINRSCFNLSCGYYCPHTAGEYIIFPEVQKCLSLVSAVLTSVPVKPYKLPVKKVYKGHKSYTYTGYDEWSWEDRTTTFYPPASRPDPGKEIVRKVYCPFRKKEVELTYNLARDYITVKGGSFYTLDYNEFEKAYMILKFYAYIRDELDEECISDDELDTLLGVLYDA